MSRAAVYPNQSYSKSFAKALVSTSFKEITHKNKFINHHPRSRDSFPLYFMDEDTLSVTWSCIAIILYRIVSLALVMKQYSIKYVAVLPSLDVSE